MAKESKNRNKNNPDTSSRVSVEKVVVVSGRSEYPFSNSMSWRLPINDIKNYSNDIENYGPNLLKKTIAPVIVKGVVDPGRVTRAMGALELLAPSDKLKEARPTAPQELEDTKNNIQKPFTASADPKEVGNMLAELRESKDMTKVATAAAMQKTENTVRSMESGANSQTISKVQEYAAALGYNVEIRLVPQK